MTSGTLLGTRGVAMAIARNRVFTAGRHALVSVLACVGLAQAARPAASLDAESPAPVPADPAPVPTDLQDVTEIIIQAPEARYVSPTRRDRIGRIWAPVYINGKGPFRLVLDTGADHSCVIAEVARALGLTLDDSAPVRVRAVTGEATVSSIKVESLLIGDLLIKDSRLPVVADALGGAEGVLGNEELTGRRVFIDFHHDLITISRSHYRSAAPGFLTVPFSGDRNRLLTVETELAGVRTKAIIDTGAQISVGNLALRDALLNRKLREPVSVELIAGVTGEIQKGEGRSAPAIEFGPFKLLLPHMTFADARIFEYWHLQSEPALLIGMDVLGLLDALVIDYQLRELQLRVPAGQ
jgi:predicted aspartyl protease